MKKILVLLLILGQSFLYGYTGEIIIKFRDGTTPGTFTLNVTSSDYSWHWENNSVIRDNNLYSRSVSGTSSYTFDAPKSVDDGNAAISWGLMQFTLTTNTGLTKTFKLDLRDEHWSTDYTDHDTYILINNNNGSVLLSRNGGANPSGYIVITNGQTYKIWEFWDRSSAWTDNFKIPVKLVNEVENTSVRFGYLIANSRQIGTDNFEDIKMNEGQVTHGSLDTNYSGRKYSFKWSHRDVESINSVYSSTTSFNSENTVSDSRQVTRIFKQVYPLTIRNNIGEIGTSSYNTILFKDPTTTNLLSSVSVSGNGYVNNEAFGELNETVNNQPDQKYAVQAVSSILYNGKDYYWYEGDFSPDSSLDLYLTGAANLNSYYKGHLLSINPSAFSTNGQRKIVRDDMGRLNLIYESMGYVWLTTSSDNGATWSPEVKVSINNGLSKCPSIAQGVGSGNVSIVYQSENEADYGSASPSIILSEYYNGNHVRSITVNNETFDYSYDAYPVVANYSNQFYVVYKCSSAAALSGVKVSFDGFNLVLGTRTQIPGSTSASKDPTITWGTVSGVNKFFLAYTHSGTGSSAIKYLDWAMGSAPSSLSLVDISENSGYPYHDHPSVSQYNGNPVVSWNFSGGYGSPGMVKRRISGTWSSPFIINVLSADGINTACTQTTTEGAIIAWGSPSGPSQFIKLNNGSYSSIISLSSNGRINVSEGSSFANIKAVNYNTSSSPYIVNPLSYNFNTLSKSNSADSISPGRLAVISAGKAEFSYFLGDVKVNDMAVYFKNYNSLMELKSSSEQSGFLETTVFELSPGSKLAFNSSYHSIKTENIGSNFNNDNYVNFRIDLISAGNNEVIASYNNVSFTKNNPNDSDKVSFSIDCNGIKEGMYFLKVVGETNSEAGYYIAEVISENSVELLKDNRLIEETVNNTAREYNLNQNYPNPFNPVTTITYQLPRDGMVTLKIYDAIGTEVTTLVDEFKSSGRYNVTFNASSLASGVYFYCLQVNDFTSSKKLVLMK